jgi:hypothetical protein
VRKVGVEQPEVTQRLKRFATIVDKLRRQPTMALSRMEDIGGARVTVPTQDQVDAIVRDLRSQPRRNVRRVREYGARSGPEVRWLSRQRGGVADSGDPAVVRRRQAILDELTRPGGLSARELSERLPLGGADVDLLGEDLEVLRVVGQ